VPRPCSSSIPDVISIVITVVFAFRPSAYLAEGRSASPMLMRDCEQRGR
jgi:hypothetical protein